MYIKSLHEISEELKTHSIVEAKLTYAEIIDIILKSLEDPEAEELLWKYASLSNAYLALGNHAEAEKRRDYFTTSNPYNGK